MGFRNTAGRRCAVSHLRARLRGILRREDENKKGLGCSPVLEHPWVQPLHTTHTNVMAHLHVTGSTQGARPICPESKPDGQLQPCRHMPALHGEPFFPSCGGTTAG